MAIFISVFQKIKMVEILFFEKKIIKTKFSFSENKTEKSIFCSVKKKMSDKSSLVTFFF